MNEREVSVDTRSATARLSDPLRSSALDSLYCLSSVSAVSTAVRGPPKTIAFVVTGLRSSAA